MKLNRSPVSLLGGAVALLCSSWALLADATPSKKARSEEKDNRVSVDVAKDRAKLLQQVYSSTLDVMHDRYFRREGAVLPARAIEDIFDEIDFQSNIKSRWIAVNTPAMSITHEPKTAFEKEAAKQLAAGKEEYVKIENGYYNRATPIPLGTGCVACHTKFFTEPPKTPRFSGLIISIPVKDK
jgi:hypothetical protein